MIAKLTGIGIALLLGATGLFADTIPGGDVSGNWYASHSPYYIAGNIRVPAGDTLTIEPAVRVNFLGGYYFTVNGWLEAVGTGTDSIYFAGGNRFVFSDAPDSSHLVYCSIVTTGPAVECNNSDPVISHSSVEGGVYGISVVLSSNPSVSDCIISNTGVGIFWNANTSGTVSGCTINNGYNGGVRKEAGNLTLTNCIIDNCDWSGVYNRYGNLTLIDCTISNDTVMTGPGGGVRSNGDTLNLIDCTIRNNYAYSAPPYTDGGGGGVYCQDGTVTITNCTISRNGANHTSGTQIGGGGIGLRNANATLSHCTIFDNIAAFSGGGIETNNSSSHSLIIDHCTIDANESFLSWPGNGIRIIGSTSTADVTNSIISNNYGQGEYAIYNEGTLVVDYTDFYRNEGGDAGGNIPPGFGVLDTTNHNGDSCDVYYNIFLDPMFVDTVNRDYHLTRNSPCIDAGDPLFAHDPDSTITDMGRYYFNQGGSGVEVSQPLRLTPHASRLTVFPNPFASFAIVPGHKSERFILYDISGRKVGTFKGDRIGEGLTPGVYFLRTADGSSKPLRIVKVR
jgi:parallel beta-helix repeat protein